MTINSSHNLIYSSSKRAECARADQEKARADAAEAMLAKYIEKYGDVM